MIEGIFTTFRHKWRRADGFGRPISKEGEKKEAKGHGYREPSRTQALFDSQKYVGKVVSQGYLSPPQLERPLLALVAHVIYYMTAGLS